MLKGRLPLPNPITNGSNYIVRIDLAVPRPSRVRSLSPSKPSGPSWGREPAASQQRSIMVLGGQPNSQLDPNGVAAVACRRG
jgi:hypothetical protein